MCGFIVDPSDGPGSQVEMLVSSNLPLPFVLCSAGALEVEAQPLGSLLSAFWKKAKPLQALLVSVGPRCGANSITSVPMCTPEGLKTDQDLPHPPA